MSQCDKHADRKAVHTCRSCGRNLCGECVAQEKEGKALCYDCAVKVTLEEFDGIEKRHRAIAVERKREAIKEAKKDARRGPRPFYLFVIIGTIIVIAQAGIVLTDYLMRNRSETSVIWSGLMQTRYERDLCADNLHRLSVLVEEYKNNHDGSLPVDLGAVIGDSADPVLVCPSSGEPYIYTVVGNGFTITCPSPEVHELGFLSSHDGTIVWRRWSE